MSAKVIHMFRFVARANTVKVATRSATVTQHMVLDIMFSLPNSRLTSFPSFSSGGTKSASEYSPAASNSQANLIRPGHIWGGNRIRCFDAFCFVFRVVEECEVKIVDLSRPFSHAL